MGYFQDTRVCDEHGFVLSPEGVCLRCAKDGEVAARRRRVAKVATGVTVVVAAVCGITVARARVNPVEPAVAVAPPPVAATAPPAPPPGPAVQDEAPRASGDWDRAMAKAEAQRVQAANAQAAAEKAREVAATSIPTPPPEEDEPPPRAEPAGDPIDPMFAPTRTTQRYYRRRAAGVTPTGGVAGSVTNPGAWGLPANNGGYFRNRTGGH